MKKIFFVLPIFVLLVVASWVANLEPKEDVSHRVMVGERMNTFPVVDLELDDSDARETMSVIKTIDLSGHCTAYDEWGKKLGRFELERIHSRGHNSFSEIKQGYSIKFTKNVDLYNMGKAKKYVLLPCYRDTSLIPYLINTKIANDLDFGYDLDLQPVHLNLNSEYMGLYLLAEKIELDPSRVPIIEKGAFIFELADRDYYYEGGKDTEDREFLDVGNEHLLIRDYLGTNLDEIQNKLDESFLALADEDKIWDYWDLDSVAKLVATCFAASEGSVSASIFFVYVPSDDKIYAMPMWDTEHAYLTNEKLRFYTVHEWYDFISTYSEIYSYFEKNEMLDMRVREIYKDDLRDSLINIRENLDNDYIEKYDNDLRMDFDTYGKSLHRPLDVDEKAEDLRVYFSEIIDICDKEWLE